MISSSHSGPDAPTERVTRQKKAKVLPCTASGQAAGTTIPLPHRVLPVGGLAKTEAPSGPEPSQTQTWAGRRLHWAVVLFMIGLVVPLIISIGPLRMSPYRFVLIVTTLPCVFIWLSGRAGPIRVADVMVLAMWAWITLSLTVIHGIGTAVEGGGMLFVEAMGGYLLARCLVRDEKSFYQMVNVLFLIVAVLLPFAVIEAFTGQNLVLRAFDSLLRTFPDIYKTPRWGMRRVQGPFEHPILFGVFCGSVLAVSYMVLGYGKPVIRKVGRSLLVAATGFFSLSSGPATAMVVQIMLISWDEILRRIKQRWYLLIAGALFAVIAVELVASRPLPEILIGYFAFNTRTAWARILIWDFGTASVLRNPLFGVGHNEWQNLRFMSQSIDMFWLAPAVRFGLPAAVFAHLAFLAAFLSVALKKGLNDRLVSYRTGYLISILGFYFAGWTVNYWNATYVLFFFMLGSGMWLLDVKKGPTRK